MRVGAFLRCDQAPWPPSGPLVLLSRPWRCSRPSLAGVGGAICLRGGVVVVAWGLHGGMMGRVGAVRVFCDMGHINNIESSFLQL